MRQTSHLLICRLFAYSDLKAVGGYTLYKRQTKGISISYEKRTPYTIAFNAKLVHRIIRGFE